MQPELIFVESYIGFEKWQFAFVLAILASTSWFYRQKKVLPLLLLPLTMQTTIHSATSTTAKNQTDLNGYSARFKMAGIYP